MYCATTNALSQMTSIKMVPTASYSDKNNCHIIISNIRHIKWIELIALTTP